MIPRQRIRRTLGKPCRLRQRLSLGRGARGFTLIELLVAMGLVGVIAAGILGLYAGVVRSTFDQTTRIQNQDSGRTATNQMSRYIRGACSSASNMTSQSDAFAVTLPQELVFFTDLDGDDKADKVHYYLSGTELMMQTAAPDLSQSPATYPAYTTDGVVIPGVRNASQAIFRYYRYDETTLSLVEIPAPNTPELRGQVVAVDIRLVVNETPELAKGAVELATRVQVRQRYDGGLDGS